MATCRNEITTAVRKKKKLFCPDVVSIDDHDVKIEKKNPSTPSDAKEIHGKCSESM
jgi:hypothetical protein